MDSNYKTIQDDLAKAGITPHLNIFYSIEMGLQGKSWQEITQERADASWQELTTKRLVFHA